MVSAETQDPKQAIITTKKVREEGRKESKERKEGRVDLTSGSILGAFLFTF